MPRDVVLSWTPGPSAGKHDVYFGTDLTAVTQATAAAAGAGVYKGRIDSTTYTAGLLAYGQTYYWRIDEVDPAPSNVIKGTVWSFTVEPYSYRIKPAAATASSAAPGMGPEKTIDGSGLIGDLHGVEQTTMWVSTGTLPNWIQYEFDQVYRLESLQVWNSNQLIESLVGWGAKKVMVETSTDGVTWTPVANVPEFAQAPGAAGYAANTTVNLGPVQAKYVKLTISTTWGGITPQAGLSEVRFSYVPVQARSPQPASGAQGVGIDAALDWRPGRGAASHQVYFGTDAGAVTAQRRRPRPSPIMLSSPLLSCLARPTTGGSMRSTPSRIRAASGASPRRNTRRWTTSRATRTKRTRRSSPPGSTASPAAPAAQRSVT